MKSISIYELINLLNTKNINLIDIRSNAFYNKGTIPSAINIEAANLINAPARYLNYNDTYYIFCEHGYTSKKVCNVLRGFGYNVINISGGYSSYKQKR